jgi:SAM-dependent methyltransferase
VTAHPGSPTAFEDLVEDYDAARPSYPTALYDEIGALGDCLELGAGTGIASAELVKRGRLIVSDLGPKMLAKGLPKHGRPAVVCRAEQLPFKDGRFDTVCGAQMWHWVDKAIAPVEVARVLRPGGRLLLWWNETQPANLWWWDRQQDRLEAGNPSYSRGYREIDYGAQLGRWFDTETPVTVPWERTLTPALYGRWLRSKSYVQALPDVDASLADLAQAFPDGQIVEPFVTRLWRFTSR